MMTQKHVRHPVSCSIKNVLRKVLLENKEFNWTISCCKNSFAPLFLVKGSDNNYEK